MPQARSRINNTGNDQKNSTRKYCSFLEDYQFSMHNKTENLHHTNKMNARNMRITGTFDIK